MLRTDHSMRPPAPAATVAFKSPNACNHCHRDRDTAWSERAVKAWYPQDYQAAVSAERWTSPTLVGADSLLEARKWWESDPKPKTLLAGYLATLGAKHFVFGHDPSALGENGKIADDKDNMRLIVSQVILNTLDELKMAYPVTTPERAAELQAMRKELTSQ